MLTLLTLLELTGGLILVYGIYFSFVKKTTLWIFYGLVITAVNFIILFTKVKKFLFTDKKKPKSIPYLTSYYN